jgi:hypothetical protein
MEKRKIKVRAKEGAPFHRAFIQGSHPVEHFNGTGNGD